MRVEFFFDFTCPYAYLGSLQVEAVCDRTGAELVWRPILLGGLFREIGQSPGGPMESMPAAKARHNAADLQRFAGRLGAPLTMPAAHPMRSVRALRTVLALAGPRRAAFIHAVYRAYWQRGEDIAADSTLARALEEAGIPAEERQRALAADADTACKEALIAATREAAERGAFGVPTMFAFAGQGKPPEMFFGQDRLLLVEAALGGKAPAKTVAAPAGKARELHFWYDFSSPFAYLASTQIENLAARTGASLHWRPMLLGALFDKVGTPNVPLLAASTQKRAYMAIELSRWAAHWQVPFRFTTHFPLRTVTALRLALLAGPRVADLSHALYRAAWADNKNIAEPAVLADVLNAVGLDPALVERTQEPAVKQALFDSTAAAASAGVFGAPTCIVKNESGQELFWGQDRLELVEELLRKA